VATVYSLFSDPSLKFLWSHAYTFRMRSHHLIHPLLRPREVVVK
jgi:hypothetical protein